MTTWCSARMSKYLLVFLVFLVHLNSIQVQATKTLESGWEHLIRKEISQKELKCKDKLARLADCHAAKEEDKEEKYKEGDKEEAKAGFIFLCTIFVHKGKCPPYLKLTPTL